MPLGTDLPEVLSGARKRLVTKPKSTAAPPLPGRYDHKGYIAAGSKDYAISGEKLALAVMTVTSQNISFGTGSANFSLTRKVQEAARMRRCWPLKVAAGSRGYAPGRVNYRLPGF